MSAFLPYIDDLPLCLKCGKKPYVPHECEPTPVNLFDYYAELIKALAKKGDLPEVVLLPIEEFLQVRDTMVMRGALVHHDQDVHILDVPVKHSAQRVLPGTYSLAREVSFDFSKDFENPADAVEQLVFAEFETKDFYVVSVQKQMSHLAQTIQLTIVVVVYPTHVPNAKILLNGGEKWFKNTGAGIAAKPPL